MTNITLTGPVFYKKGQAGVSAVVGYESSSNRVARYSFTAPDGGATAISLAFSGNWTGRGEKPKLAFYIGTDPSSHADAGQGSTATGTLTLQADYYSYAGSAPMLLLPGVTYYVWVFPTTKVFGWLQWGYDAGDAVATLSGAAISHIAAVDGVLGESVEINITRYGDYAHTVTCTFGAETLTLCENSRETQLSWTPPLHLASQIPDSAAGQAIYTVYTEDLGAMQCTAQLSVPQTLAPTVDFTWSDGAELSYLLQWFSALEVTVEASALYDAAIKEVAVTLGGKPYTGGVLTEAGENILTVTVTDSRGLTASKTEKLTVRPYQRPKVTLTGSRCDQDGTANDMGEFVCLTADFTFTVLDTQLQPQLLIRYPGGEPLAQCQPTESGSFSCILPASSVTSPRFEAALTDGAPQSAAAQFQLPIGYATLDFLAGGKGIAFGTTATQEGFVCAMPARFLGGVEGIFPFTESAEHPGCFCRTVDGVTEWLNPPMVLKTEYRTAERYDGQPVYTKLVDLGELPNNTVKYVDAVVGGGWSRFLDYGLTADFDLAPVRVTGTGDGRWAWLIVTTTADMSGKTAQCILKYLK